MVAAEYDAETAGCCVVIRPNCSLSWRGTLVVFGGISLVSFVITLGFLLQGYWLTLPFAGLDLVLLGTALYITAWHGISREVIRVEGGTVAVQKGHRHPEVMRILPRPWMCVELSQPRLRGYSTRVLLRSHGQEVHVGDCLNERERCQLANDLRRWVDPAPPPLTAA